MNPEVIWLVFIISEVMSGDIFQYDFYLIYNYNE